MISLRFIALLIKHIAILLLLLLPLQLLGSVILLIYLPIHKYLVCNGLIRSIKLPYLLRWFDNADLYVGRDISTYVSVFGSTFLNWYIWLAWRNPLNYFGYVILGFQVNDVKCTMLVGDENVGDSTDDVPGFRLSYLFQDNYRYYEYYYIKKYSSSKCLRFRMGWKIGNPTDNKKGAWVQYVFTLQPYKSYAGK